MVAPQSPVPPAASSSSTVGERRRIPIRGRSHIQRLFLSLIRVSSIQSRLLLLEAKLTIQRIMLYAAFAAAGGLLGVLAIIFLYIGVFKVLAMFVPSPWVWLIYGGAHLVLAAGLILIGRHIMSRPLVDSDDQADPTDAEAQAEAEEGSEVPAPW